MEVALEQRTVDTRKLLRICAGRFACTIVAMILQKIASSAERKVNTRIRRWFALRAFQAYVRLDVPTFSRLAVQSQLSATTEDFTGRTVIWETLRMVTDVVSKCATLTAQGFVLFNALRGQKDGRLLALTTLASEVLPFMTNMMAFRQTIGAVFPTSTNYLHFLSTNAMM